MSDHALIRPDKITFSDVIIVLLGGIDRHIRILRLLYALAAIGVLLGIMLLGHCYIFLQKFGLPVLMSRPYDISLWIAEIQHCFVVIGFVPMFLWEATLVLSGAVYVFIGRSWRLKRPPTWGVGLALLFAGIVLTFVILNLFLLFADIYYPSVSEPKWLTRPVNAQNLFPIMLVMIWTIMFILFFWLRRRFRWPALTLWLSAAVALIGCFAFLSSLSVFSTDNISQSWLARPAQVVSVLAILWGLGTALFIYRVGSEDHKNGNEIKGVGPDYAGHSLDARPCISSARALSLIVIGLLVVSFDVAFSHLERVKDLQTARRVYALQYVATRLQHLAKLEPGPQLKQLVSSWSHVSKSVASAQEEVEWTVDYNEIKGIGNTSISFLFSHDGTRFKLENLTVVVSGRGQWSVRDQVKPHGPYYVEEGNGDVANFQKTLAEVATLFEQSLRSLSEIAFRWRVDVPDNRGDDHKRFYRLYRQIEREFVTREVSVPTVAVGVTSLTAMWWMSIAIVGFLILIRNRARSVLRDPTFARAEPWLIIDQTVGLERWLAKAWLWSVLLSPWLVGALLLMTVSGQMVADGVSQPLAFAFVWLVGLIAIPMVGGWIAASLVAVLITLRQMRAQNLEPRPKEEVAP